MRFHKFVKPVFLAVYSNIKVSAPPMPNHFAFMIDTLGFTLTMTNSNLLFYFLTRPANQKNLLNRILSLAVLIGIPGTF